MSTPQPPTPNPSRDYKKSLAVYLRYLPQLLEAEQGARQTYDPKRIQEQQQLQDQYGPHQYQQQLDALKQLDPQGVAVRQQLGTAVSRDLASGYHLPAGLQTEINSQIRGRQALTGNELGNAPAAADALFQGNAMQQLYQQHLTNAGNFLAGATPEQQISVIQPVSPDRSSQYTNPSAPGSLAAPNFQNQLAAWQASGAGRSPWAGALAGAAGGAISGATIGSAVPGYGTAIGAAAGGIVGGVGGYFSDARAKHDITYTGEVKNGLKIAEFCYNDCPGRFRGVIAQDVLSVRPDAVHMDGSGLWKVDYQKLGIQLEEIPDLVEA